MDTAPVAGRFVLEQLAGSGGMRRVFQARDLVSKARVALELLRPGVDLEPRFTREARSLAQLSHPAVAPYVSHGVSEDGELYLATDWVDGESLADRVGRAPLSARDAVTLGIRVAEGLGAAHRLGIVHRDVKPANLILVDGRIDRVTIVDFGIGGAEEIDARADVSALGRVLHHCVTGKPPGGEAARAEVPEALAALIARMTARAPEERPADGTAVAEALRGLGPLEAQPLGEAPTQASPRQRRAVGLAPGVVLAGRWRIVRFIAEGGMGEVYEAQDYALGERVALKTIRGEAAREGVAVERFRREIQLARKVTHANVCRIFDLGVDEQTGTTFLSMELLEGETLAERIRRQGAMAPDEALPLVEQMVAGLTAAHGAGVLHRDFKSANVMLVPRDGDGVRAVITDFGLARTTSGDDRLTHTGGIVGTPAYMAPEQLTGAAPTPAMDVYALGVVLHEMVTGELPFAASGALPAALRRAGERSPSPRAKVPSLPAIWDQVIVRCLELDPSRRFAVPGEVAAALRGVARPKRRRWPLFAALALAAGGAIGGAALLSSSGGASAPAVADAGPRRALAVLGFKNLSADPEAVWLSTAIAELLASELAAGGALRVVPVETVARARLALRIADNDNLSPDILRRVQATLGADYVVVGSYLPSPGKLRVDVRVLDARSGDTVAQASETRSEDQLADLTVGVATRVSAQLGARPESPVVAPPRGVLPQGATAVRLYAEALALLRAFEYQRARDLLERVIALDAGFAPARGALATALIGLGYDEAARAAVRRGIELSGELPADEQLKLQAELYAINLEWRKALDINRQRFAASPDDVDTGLSVIEGLLSLGDRDEARRVIDTVRRLPGGDHPQLDLYEASLLAQRGDLDGALAAAGRARARGEALGAAAMVPGALSIQADVHFQRGELDAARRDLSEAVELTRAIGDRDGVCQFLMVLGGIELSLGKPDEAEKNIRQVLAVQRELGSYKRRIFAFWALAYLALERGDLPGLERTLAEARADLAGSPIGVPPSIRFMWTGILALSRGDLATARNLLEEARRQLRIKSGPELVAMASAFLAEALLRVDDLLGARALLEELMQNPSLDKTRTQVLYAMLELADGKPREAEPKARAAMLELRRGKQRVWEGVATAELARALLADGRADEARVQADEAAKLVENSRLPGRELGARIDVARVRGDLAALEAAAGDAHRLGLVGLELDARFAQAELDPKRAPALAREARKRGFLNLARRASALK